MISIVVPCFNSGERLALVVESVRSWMADRPEQDYEIILVNDCSSDGTWENIVGLSSNNDKIIGLDLARNTGQANAVMAGLNEITGDYAVTLEDDGQSTIEDAWNLVGLLDDDHDIACAKNVSVPKRGLVRSIGRYANWAMLDLFLDNPKGLSPSAFFAAKKNVIDEMVRYSNPYTYFGGLILRSSSRIAQLEVNRHDRISGSSGYSLKKLISLFFNGVTTFSVKPLHFGFVSAWITALFMIAFVIMSVIGASRPEIGAFSLSFGVFSLLFSILLLTITASIAADYVGRIYMCINKAPQFVIRKKVHKGIVSEHKKDCKAF